VLDITPEQIPIQKQNKMQSIIQSIKSTPLDMAMKHEIMKVLMNHENPVVPSGDFNIDQRTVTTSVGNFILEISYSISIVYGCSVLLYIKNDITGLKFYVEFKGAIMYSITQIHEISSQNPVRVTYTFWNGELNSVIFNGRSFRDDDDTFISVAIPTMKTTVDGENPNNYAHTLYNGFMAAGGKSYPKTVADITTPEVAQHIGEWVDSITKITK
jgi:hypothetical protein